MARNGNRPYTEEKLMQISEDVKALLGEVKELKVQVNMATLGLQAVKDNLDCVGNIEWLREELKRQGKIS